MHNFPRAPPPLDIKSITKYPSKILFSTDYRRRQLFCRRSLRYQLLPTLGIPAGALARTRNQLAILTFRLRQARRIQAFLSRVPGLFWPRSCVGRDAPHHSRLSLGF